MVTEWNEARVFPVFVITFYEKLVSTLSDFTKTKNPWFNDWTRITRITDIHCHWIEWLYDFTSIPVISCPLLRRLSTRDWMIQLESRVFPIFTVTFYGKLFWTTADSRRQWFKRRFIPRDGPTWQRNEPVKANTRYVYPTPSGLLCLEQPKMA